MASRASLNIVVPAAGNSVRFKDAGIEIPKPLIELVRPGRGRGTMLEHALQPWMGTKDGVKITVGCQYGEDAKEFQARLPRWIDVCGMKPTKGQASTVFNVASTFEGGTPLLVINSDVGIDYPLDIFATQCQAFHAGALVFPSCDERYSFIDEYPLFDKPVEKRNISGLAMSGATYFASTNLFLDSFKRHEESNTRHNGELYLSETLGFCPGRKLAVAAQANQLHQWGTPSEVRDAIDRGEVIIVDPLIHKKIRGN